MTNTAPGVAQEQQPRGFQKAKEVGVSGSSLPRVLKTGMIAKKPAVELKGVRDDIEEEDEEESYYRFVNFITDVQHLH